MARIINLQKKQSMGFTQEKKDSEVMREQGC